MSDIKLEVKAGDTVLVQGRDWERLDVVDHITKGGNISVNGILYNPNGMERGGDSFYKTWIKKPTEEEVDRIRKERYTRKVLRTLHALTKLSYTDAVAIGKVIGVIE